MPRVNLEGASLKSCSMDERLGIHTNLEGTYVQVCGVHVCVYYTEEGREGRREREREKGRERKERERGREGEERDRGCRCVVYM